MRFPKTLKGTYADVRRRYGATIGGNPLPPPNEVNFHVIDDFGEGPEGVINTRCEEAAVLEGEDGKWSMYINRTLLDFRGYMYITVAHECLHIAFPNANHNDKVWNAAFRRLQGAGLFRRIF